MSRSLATGRSGTGAPIVGVASTSDKESLKEIDGKNKYSEWEFVYDPTLDPFARSRGAAPGMTPGTGTGANPNSPQTPQTPQMPQPTKPQ